ncbi:class II fumarate hydratase [Halodesulfovibrio marinisediminis]|uniref:Fumarate hydratase class II n=1 Tax=Halodesulfovibrio marinisediminis DSM 17456 TaxID=1121457 RepID=A0A1N6GL25_9BACT|nr:class II fumarate hydratase [Halodesulfovibrio marinisediminis]SIO08258.1 fumarase, class II [Halodesulfovibrio marinisediminis DSM 17456]
MTQGVRIESDSMGNIEVPEDCYWGAQTQRSLQHFAIGAERIPLEVIIALAHIKKAAAHANVELGVLSEDIGHLIIEVADEICNGGHDGQFPLHVWQTGSGTQTNMNVNEVIANRANEIAGSPLGSKAPVHPNDHVNRSQSSNDVFPTAMNVAAAIAIEYYLVPAIEELVRTLEEKAEQWANVPKLGRTHRQDAVPMTVGQEFSAYAHQLEAGLDRLGQALPQLHSLPLGGTAVGTGLNAPKGFAERAIGHLAEYIGIPFIPMENAFAGLSSSDDIVAASGAVRTLACSLLKIANDIAMLSSGPRAGIGEYVLPANEPGSSIMPGKVNPTQCEALSMVCVQVMGLDSALSFAGSQGVMQLNVYRPLMIHNLLTSIRLITDSTRMFTRYAVEGLELNYRNIEDYLSSSLMLVTALTPVIGYDKAAQMAKKAYEQDRTLKEVVLEDGLLDEKEFDDAMNYMRMAKPHSE